MMKSRSSFLAELIGTMSLLMAVIGSGVMAERLSSGNIGLALLANTLTTVFALYVLIEIFSSISGAHFNPVVSLVMLLRGDLKFVNFCSYICAQLSGAILGAWLVHLMFNMPIFQLSTHVRFGVGQFFAEALATAGLLIVILLSPKGKTSSLVACYIGAAYWFTASTSFANPAAVVGRMLSDSFAGIAPSSSLFFITAEIAGALSGWGIYKLFHTMDASRDIAT